MKKRVLEYIKRYDMISQGETVVVGVSGGADSVCLLLMLSEISNEIPMRLIAVHLNHGIRKEAKEDASFVKRLAEKLGIPFFLFCEDVQTKAVREGISTEEAGREARYGVFQKVLREQAGGQGRIAVAHNRNDQAETVLFHLFRGTGLLGMAGIRPIRGQVIRPVLCLTREEIETYLHRRGNSWCIDLTNAEDTYSRNKVRHHILDYAEREICNGAAGHICEAAERLSEAERYISRQAAAAFEACASVETALEASGDEGTSTHGSMSEAGRRAESVIWNAEAFGMQDEILHSYMILRGLELLTGCRKDISAIHVSDVKRLLLEPGNRRISLPGGLEAERRYRDVILHRRKDENDVSCVREMVLPVPGEQITEELGCIRCDILSNLDSQIIPQKTYTKWFDYDKINCLVLRSRRTGDYLTINSQLGKKTLKEYMIQEKIPRERRGSLPVLADGSHIIWVIGGRISEYYKVTDQTKRVLQVQIGGRSEDG